MKRSEMTPIAEEIVDYGRVPAAHHHVYTLGGTSG